MIQATNKQPQGPAKLCGSVNPEDPIEIAKLAQTGSKFDPPIKTFVIGLPGVQAASADAIAKGGATDKAILVGTADPAEAFYQALVKARGQALPCSYPLPAKVKSGEIDYDHVNMDLSYPEGSAKPKEKLVRDDACEGPGWKYGAGSPPDQIVLCPQTCQDLRDDFDATIDVILGCKTDVAK